MRPRGYSLPVLLVVSSLALSGEPFSLRVPERDAKKAVISKVPPEYPAMARQLKLTGHVELEAMVTQEGTVDSIKIVNAHPLLGAAAIAAVKKWKFTPFTADGKAAGAIVTLTFDFH